MARKTETVTIPFEGRDKGKVFILTELSAVDAEDWAMRALFALMNSGVEIPDNLVEAGLAGLYSIGMDALTKLPYEAAKPLLESMMKCIQAQPSPTVVRALVDSDIEEVATRLELRKRVLALHMDFSMAAVLSTSGLDAAKQASA